MDPVPPELEVEAPEGPGDLELQVDAPQSPDDLDMANSMNMQALVQQLRAEAAQQIEAAVATVWNKGLKGLQQAQEKRAAQNAALEAELQTFKERQELLVQENKKLRGAVESLVRCMSGLAVYPPTPGGQGSDFFSFFEGNEVFTSAQSPASMARDPFKMSESLNIPEPLKKPACPPPLPPPGISRESSSGTAAASTAPQTPTSSVDSEPATGQTTFSFTLRKADGVSLGLDVSHAKGSTGLCVEKIQAGGAVEAWNRQCPTTAHEAETRVVLPGDMVVAVNNVSGEPNAMLAECRNRQLLRITIRRPAAPAQDKPAGAPSGCTLEAEQKLNQLRKDRLDPPRHELSVKQNAVDHAAGHQSLQFAKFGG